MADDSSSSYQIEPLNGENYHTWRIHDDRRSRRAPSFGNLLVYVQDATTSKEAWDTLAETFQETGPIGIIEARRKLFRAQCPKGGDIKEHLHRLRAYRSELQSLGQTLSDSNFSMIILTSLPESWNPFIRAIDLADLLPSAFGCAAKLTSAKLVATEGSRQEERHLP
ncbi:hypothetical protein NUW54_g4037 [Trametes sanguinea]|uniref:Uncharacterized protein n=1 Tax=Trametes sanguinea TaxID=158606 RepID=A0ACC1Q2L7_9APHY|nr:hypothetical protein NUW54_g4037 [Trametes sanguinea]